MSYRQRILDRIHIVAQRKAAELKPLAYHLNANLCENARHLLAQVEAGQTLSAYESKHLIDLHEKAQALSSRPDREADQ